jgi:EmrB/QacA subfamily drug resistance transporter
MQSKLRSRRPLVLASVIAAMIMIALEATIVATAMPQIASQLGDLHLYSWIFAAFLLTQTAGTVIFGKLADIFGRKPVLLVGIGIFLVGSLLCGFAWTMPALILFRLIQGVGAGAIQPVSITLVGDLYPMQERGRIQGYLASVWGIFSVLGPIVGGLIVRDFSWAWVFWINLPIGVLAAIGILVFLHEEGRYERPSVDVAGAALFTIAVTSLMIALTESGTSSGDLAWGALGVFLAASATFIWQERRAPHPIIAFGLWSRRQIASVNMACLLSGMALIGLTTFLPMYVQAVLQRSALVAGLALTMVVLGWPIGSTIAARTFVRFGLRQTLLFGCILMPVGGLAFVLLGPGSAPWTGGMGSLVMGLGAGFLSTSSILIIQNCTDWSERGAGTSSNIFSRNVGSTLGAAVFGAVLNFQLARGAGGHAPVSSAQIQQLLADSSAAAGADAAVRAALAQALHVTFWAVFVIAVLTLIAAMFVPRVQLKDAGG